MWGYSIWKGLGWGAIIYFAAVAGIDQEQYEAARVDGAGRFATMRYVTLPGLLPTYFVLLILSIANFLNNGMEQFFVFQNPMNRARIEVLDLFVFNQGMANINVSFATAVGVLRSLVSVVLLFSANALSKVFRGEPIF
jgi:putative aldouronate transport system permease protein